MSHVTLFHIDFRPDSQWTLEMQAHMVGKNVQGLRLIGHRGKETLPIKPELLQEVLQVSLQSAGIEGCYVCKIQSLGTFSLPVT